MLCYRNGERYEGNWREDTAHGKGTLTYAGGDKYVGEWAEGKKHGTGELHYVNGDVFKGEWRNDFACGHGLLAYANGDAYDGQVRGVGVGRGDACRAVPCSSRRASRDGSTPESERDKPPPTTLLTCLRPPTHVLPTQWLNDRRHGQGKFTSAQDGKAYEGQWRDGMRHGTGVLALRDGDALRAQWENGQLVQCLDFQFVKDSPWHDPKY